MRAGRLRNKITIQTIVNSVDEFGQPLIGQNGYEDYKTVWASIVPISGKESFLSNVDFSKTTHKIKIRYIPNINASMRIIWQGRFFNIINVRNIEEMNKEYEILAWESDNGN